MNHREKILALFNRFEHPVFSAKNRFVRSATWLAGADEETGAMTKTEIGRITEIAAGGAGTIITGLAYISHEGKALKRQWGLHCDERTDDVKAIVDSVHKFDSKLIVQICHSGGQRDPSIINGTCSLSPSGDVHPLRDFSTIAMTYEDILKIRRDFTASALRAKIGGADGVEIHGGHGFLLTQFLSPVINKRTDMYGGSLENRIRLFREILSDVRTEVGPDFPVLFKISITEGTAAGYMEEDGIETSIQLLNDGADGIEVSSGTSYAGARNAPSVIGVSAGESEAPFRRFARHLKEHTSSQQIIILTGGIRSLPTMADLLQNGTCDLFGMSRPFIAEPDLVNRWYEEDSRPTACISCNACFNTVKSGIIDCPVLRDRNEGYWDPL